MKSKIIVFIIIILSVPFFGNNILAQTISGIPGNAGCLNSGIMTASSTGLGATPQYQLLKSGVVVAPVNGDPTQFTNTNVFTGLLSGSYTLKGRAISGGTVYTSSNISVTDGYTAMTVITPNKTVSCPTATNTLTTTVTKGKAPFIYSIALQSSPNTILQNSGSIAAASFTFNPLGIGDYIVNVTDACGQTVTSASSITQSGALLSQIFPQTFGLGRYNGTGSAAGLCTSKIVIRAKDNFAYVGGTIVMTTTDKANFSWRLQFNGLSYGQDNNGDGNPDLTGADFPLTTYFTNLPNGITDITTAVAGNPKMIIYDKCGNSATFAPYRANIAVNKSLCGTNGKVILNDSNGVNTFAMACYPVNWTFTSAGNPTVNYTQTTAVEIIPTNFVAGATYAVTAVDAIGTTTNLISNSTFITFPSTSNPYGVAQIIKHPSVYNSSVLAISFGYANAGDIITLKVTSTNVPAMVGYSYNYTVPTSGSGFFNPLTSFPLNSWPAGNYTFQVSGSCGISTFSQTLIGYKGVLSSLSTTPVCGGFNVIGNTTLVESTSYYEIVIVSGPSNIGAVRDLATLTTSLPFNGLTYGTYVFGIRVKGGGVVFNTQTVTYSAANAITVDTTNTGGYVCSAGATNGTLTISATTNSPAPGNTLEYAISLDGGSTFGAYQSGNIFSGLGSGTYFFKVKDGCGNVITQSSQIGVAAAPVVTVNGLPGNQSLCNTHAGETVTLTLDVNIPDATYAWTGNGITSANSNIKNPIISVADLSVGINNYSCTVTLGTPCNTTSVGNVAITILANPTVAVANPAAVCYPNTVSITQPAVTTGSDAGLAYTYFTDAAATTTLASPSAVAVSGTYYIKGTNSNGCYEIMPVTVTINPLPIATITYSNSPYCKRGTAVVTQSGITGGMYSSDAGLSINASTGEINLATSTVGSHTITYSFTNGTCANTTTAIITINATTIPTALADITAQCNTTPTAPTLSDPCAGVITATTTTAFPITTQGTTVVTWKFNYGNGYTQTVTQNVINNTCTCTKPPATGAPTQYTKMGITVQQKQSGWPENIPNGFIAMESTEKGFVITRVQNQGQIADPKAGMLIYDIDANCVKLFNGTIWNCIKKTCND